MKAISFLGTSDYSPTIYVFEGKECTTRFFPPALVCFFQPKELLVFATPTVVSHKNLEQMNTELDQSGVNWRAVEIPEGHSEDELWQIFHALTEAVEPGERVVFDITHSFRSLPVLALLAVAFLKAARDVEVERLVYGAYEARQQSSNRTPVFDLTPFAGMLDWLAATSRFVDSGDGHQLALLLRTGIPPGPLMGDDLQARRIGKGLKTAAEAVDSTSLALRLARPIEAMQSASQIKQVLEDSEPSFIRSAQPFSILAGQVQSAYGSFALEHPEKSENTYRSLLIQLNMIRWYADRRQVLQAVTLAREWLVSVSGHILGADLFNYEEGRRQVEYALNNAVERRKPDPKTRHISRYDKSIEDLPGFPELVDVWDRLSKLRNDIAHAGMRYNPRPGRKILADLESILPGLEAVSHNLLESEAAQ